MLANVQWRRHARRAAGDTEPYTSEPPPKRIYFLMCRSDQLLLVQLWEARARSPVRYCEMYVLGNKSFGF